MAGKEVVDAGMGVEAENRKPDVQRMNVWSERHMHRQVPPTPEEMILTITNRWKSKPFNRRSGVTLVVQTAFVCGHWKWCCVGNFDGFLYPWLEHVYTLTFLVSASVATISKVESKRPAVSTLWIPTSWTYPDARVPLVEFMLKTYWSILFHKITFPWKLTANWFKELIIKKSYYEINWLLLSFI